MNIYVIKNNKYNTKVDDDKNNKKYKTMLFRNDFKVGIYYIRKNTLKTAC